MGNQIITSSYNSKDYELFRLSCNGDVLNLPTADIISDEPILCTYCGEFHEINKCRYGHMNKIEKAEEVKSDDWTFQDITLLDGIADEAYIRNLSIETCSKQLLSNLDINSKFSLAENIAKKNKSLEQVHNSLLAIRHCYLNAHFDEHVPAAKSVEKVDEEDTKDNKPILNMHIKLLRNILTSETLLTEDSTMAVIETISSLLNDFNKPLALLPSKTSKDITSLVSIVSIWLSKCIATSYKSDNSKNQNEIISKASFLLLKLTSLSGSLNCALRCAKTMIENDYKLSASYIEKLGIIMDTINKIQSEFSLNANLADSSSLFLNSFKFLFPNHVESADKKQNSAPVGRNKYGGNISQEPEVDNLAESYSSLAVGPKFLYIHTSCGLAAVASGFSSSVKGKLFLLNETFHISDPGWLIYSNNFLYYKSKADKSKIFVICPEKLIEIGYFSIPSEYQNLISPIISSPNSILFKPLNGGNLIMTLVAYDKLEVDSVSKSSIAKTYFDVVILETPLNYESEMIFLSRTNLSGWNSMKRQPTTCQICKKCGIFTSYISCYLCCNITNWCLECNNSGFIPSCHISENHPTGLIPVSSDASNYSNFMTVAKPILSDGFFPSARFGHAIASYGRKIYLFGGGTGVPASEAAANITTIFNDFYCFDTETLAWSPLNCPGEMLSPRMGHSMVVLPENISLNLNARVLIFGGAADNIAGSDAYSDLYLFDLVDMVWSKPEISGAPSSRVYSSTALDPDSKILYFYGGIKDQKVFNELYALDLEILQFSLILPNSSYLPPATFAASLVYYKNSLYLLGGQLNSNNVGCLEINGFDIKNKVWSRQGNLNVYTAFATGKMIGSNFVFFTNSNSAYLTTVNFDKYNQNFSQVRNFKYMDRQLHYSSGCFVGSFIYVFGGYSIYNTDDETAYNSDFYKICVENNPSLPLSEEAMEVGKFYCNGRFLACVIDKLVSPNVLYADRQLIRVFDLQSGAFISDYENGSYPGTSFCFDNSSNTIFSYSKKSGLIKQWCNNSTIPKDDNNVALKNKIESTYDFAVNLLRLINKFISPNLISFDQPKIVEIYQRFFEPLAVEIDENTFNVLFEILAHVLNLKTTEAIDLKLILFRILATNLSKWIQSFVSKNKPTSDQNDKEVKLYRSDLYKLCHNDFANCLKSSKLDLSQATILIEILVNYLDFFFESSNCRTDQFNVLLNMIVDCDNSELLRAFTLCLSMNPGNPFLLCQHSEYENANLRLLAIQSDPVNINYKIQSDTLQTCYFLKSRNCNIVFKHKSELPIYPSSFFIRGCDVATKTNRNPVKYALLFALDDLETLSDLSVYDDFNPSKFRALQDMPASAKISCIFFLLFYFQLGKPIGELILDENTCVGVGEINKSLIRLGGKYLCLKLINSIHDKEKRNTNNRNIDLDFVSFKGSIGEKLETSIVFDDKLASVQSISTIFSYFLKLTNEVLNESRDAIKLDCCINLLQLFQSGLLSRFAFCKDINTLPSQLLFYYVKHLFDMIKYTCNMLQSKSLSVVELFINNGLIGKLLPALLTSMLSFVSHSGFIDVLLPLLSDLMPFLRLLASFFPNINKYEASYISITSGQKLLEYCTLQITSKLIDSKNAFIENSVVEDDLCYMCPQCIKLDCEYSVKTPQDLSSHLETVHPEFVKYWVIDKEETNLLLDILRLCGSLGGKCVQQMICGPPILSLENSYLDCISSKLFRNGLEMKDFDCEANTECEFLSDLVKGSNGTLGYLFSRLVVKTKGNNHALANTHPQVFELLRWVKAAFLKHHCLTTSALQFSLSLSKNRPDILNGFDLIYVDVSEMPNGIFTNIMSDSIKIKDFIQKLRQNLIASGITINFEEVARSKITFVDPLREFDIYDVICDNFIQKAKFLLYNLKSYDADSNLIRLEYSFKEWIDSVGDSQSLQELLSSWVDLESVSEPLSLKRQNSFEVVKVKKSNLSSNLILFIKSNSLFNPLTSDDREVERKAVEENSFSPFFLNNSCLPNIVKSDERMFNVNHLNLILKSRDDRANSRLKGMSHLKLMLQSSDLLSVQNEILRSVPAAFSFSKKNKYDDDNSKSLDKSWHYMDDCSGVGLMLSIKITLAIQNIMEEFVLPIMDISFRNSYNELSLTCLSILSQKFKSYDHSFLCKIKLLDNLQPLMRIHDSFDATLKQSKDIIKEASWDAFRVVLFSSFTDINSNANVVLSKFQDSLLELIYYILSLASSHFKESCMQNFELTNKLKFSEQSCYSSLSLLLSLLDSDVVSNFLLNEIRSYSNMTTILFNLVEIGSPRVQRLSIFILKKILPFFNPNNCYHLLSSLDIPALLLKLIGRLLFPQNAATLQKTESSVFSKTGNDSMSLVYELVALCQFLFKFQVWKESFKNIIFEILSEFNNSFTPNYMPTPNDILLQLVSASLLVLGGNRDSLRPGVKVQTFVSKNRQNIKIGKLVEFDEIARSGKIVYDNSTNKKPEDLPAESCCLLMESEELLANILSFSDFKDFYLIFCKAIHYVNTFDETSPSIPNLLTLRVCTQFVRVLWKSIINVDCNKSLFTMDIIQPLSLLASGESYIHVINDEQLLNAETKLHELSCKLMEANYDSVGNAFSENKSNSEELLHFNPFKSFGTVLPTYLLSESDNLTADGCSLATTGGVRAEDYTICIANVVVPDLPSYYFEIDYLDAGVSPGKVHIGFVPSNDQPLSNLPGLIRDSIGLSTSAEKYEGSLTSAKNISYSQICNPGSSMGLLWDRLSEKVYATFDGELISLPICKLHRSLQYFPSVGIAAGGARVHVNFGQEPFKFNLAASKFVPADIRLNEVSVKRAKIFGKIATNKRENRDSKLNNIGNSFEKDEKVNNCDSIEKSSNSDFKADSKIDLESKGNFRGESTGNYKEDHKEDSKDLCKDEKSEKLVGAALIAKKAQMIKEDGFNDVSYANTLKPSQASSSKALNSCEISATSSSSPLVSEYDRNNNLNPDQLSDEIGSSTHNYPNSSSFLTMDDEANKKNDLEDEDINLEADFPEDIQCDSSVLEALTQGQNNNSYYDYDYDYDYGNNSDKAKNPSNLISLESCKIGSLFLIKEKATSTNFIWRPSMDLWIGKVGICESIDFENRSILLKFKDGGGVIIHHWFSIKCLSRWKRPVNNHIYKAIPHNSDSSVVSDSCKIESTLSQVYARNAILKGLHLWNLNLTECNWEYIESFPLSSFGSIESFLLFSRKIILSSFYDKKDPILVFPGVSALNDPCNIVKCFLLNYLFYGSNSIEAGNLCAGMIDLAKKELNSIKGLGDNDINAFDGDWRSALKFTDLEHCYVSSFLLEILLYASSPLETFNKKTSNLLTNISIIQSHVFQKNIFNSIVNVLQMPPNNSYKSSSLIFQRIFPVICRYLSQAKLFKSDEIPSLNGLDFIEENISKRWESETNCGILKDPNFSRYTQSLCNLLILKQQALSIFTSSEKTEYSSFFTLDWLETTRVNADLLQGLLSGSKFPKWFYHQSWISLESESKLLEVECEHPYSESKQVAEIDFPNATSVELRINTKSRTNDSDVLKFTLNADGSNEFLRLFGTNIIHTNNASNGEVNQYTCNVPSNRLFYKFDISSSPSHAGVLCSSCDFPISGKRFTCTLCSPMINLCSTCESNVDAHDRLHILLQIKRPFPNEIKVPRIFTKSPYSCRDNSTEKLKLISNDMPSHNINCINCFQNIIGLRYRCLICENADLCSTCENSGIHDLGHLLLKIRYPIESQKALSNSNLRSLYTTINDFGMYWGYKFSAIPRYSDEYSKDLLKLRLDDVNETIGCLDKVDNSQFIRAMSQLVELVNQECEKLGSSNQKTKKQFRTRNFHLEESPQETEVSRALISPPNLLIKNEEQTQGFTALRTYSIDYLRFKFAVLRLLNQSLQKILPVIDWSLTDQSWSLSFIFGQLRSFIFSELKTQLWSNAIQRTISNSSNYLYVTLDNMLASTAHYDVKASRHELIDMSMFGQLYNQLHALPSSYFRTSRQPWNVQFKGESGVDVGGLFRDSLTQICQELQSPHLKFFLPCPNAKAGIGITLDKFIPARQANTELDLNMFSFIGKLMGVAIRVKNTLELDLPSIVWKQLVGQVIEISDLTAIDEICVKAMQTLVDDKKMEDDGVNADNFAEFYEMNFTYPYADETVIELKENGSEIPVLWQNRQEFFDLVLNIRLSEFRVQVESIRKGLIAVIPARYLSLLSWKELEIEICGSPEIDLDLLKQHTTYRACFSSDSHIAIFWKVINLFNNTERAQFLRFVWGRSRLPPASKFRATFTIDSNPRISESHLPSSHTCSFCLELPRYRTAEIMRDKIIKAITMCTSIDNV